MNLFRHGVKSESRPLRRMQRRGGNLLAFASLFLNCHHRCVSLLISARIEWSGAIETANGGQRERARHRE